MSEGEPIAATPDPAPGQAPTNEADASEPRREARPITKRRLISVNVLIAFTTLLAIVAILSVWANRLLFNPDNWENTSTQLLQNEEIRTATANYIVDQLYANVNVAGIIKSGLPTRFQALAGPASGALRNAAVQGVELALTRPRVQALWAKANRAADQTFIKVVEGGGPNVSVNQGVVTLNLATIVGNVASRLGLPADVSQKLPPSVANLTVLKSDQIKFVQNVGNAIKGLALWLTILVPLLYAAALVLATGHRRKTLRTIGFAAIFAGVVALLARSILKTQLVDSLVADTSVRPAATATIAIGTSMITEIAGAFIFIGVVLVIAAWFAGPARIAASGRRALAPYLREQPGWAFATAAGVMVLIFIWDPIPATGKPAGMIVFLLLALLGTEVLRRQTAAEFPGVAAGEATAAIRSRVQRTREGRRSQRSSRAAATPATLPEQLERLSTLRDEHKITPEEYDAAKASLLRG